jgi:Flp pilus assembly CpaF family ATPase
LRRKLRKVGTRVDDNEPAVRVEDVDTLRISTNRSNLLPSFPTYSRRPPSRFRQAAP